MSDRDGAGRRRRAWLTAAVVALAVGAHAQDEDQLLVSGQPIENVIAGRAVALRLRAEAQVTDEQTDLITEDARYARFPTELYSADARLFQRDRLTVGTLYDRWNSGQDRDTERISGSFTTPLATDWRLTLQYMRWETEGEADRNYLYTGVSRDLGPVYTYSQVRFATQAAVPENVQLYEYLSWRPATRLRLGGQGAFSAEPGTGEAGPWYAGCFTSVFLDPHTTSLRVEGLYYDSRDDLAYFEFKPYLYRMLGARTLVRFGYRYYDDTQGLSSHSGSVRLKRYFSARFAAHVGYRYYTHNEGPDLDTVQAGFSLLL